ncbi:hypothetical protein CANCADRAFT_28513 [Tortispora caseinolytica NRRL Y-17796]|uniref:Casein kinase II subunit beta n=1 Tax=Tortispora caseinolytica NRRL Y-17796 TaxID=767744 RepID=A0A1E4TAH2_9ASCO|nr:hypothetical protein CANCADRAFT_28513 [Tortispora caseinolytica NRRL Y-17796]
MDRYAFRYDDEIEEGSSSSSIAPRWIEAFCANPMHRYLAMVADEFIEDDFNLTGLSSVVPHFTAALDMILDIEVYPEDRSKLPAFPVIEHSAVLLYGLIHARYILSRQGLQAMAEKYEQNHFGTCPRHYCDSSRVLPVGRSDIPGVDSVKLYCPSCGDIYTPPSSRFNTVDGAFFGTTFPGLFLTTFSEIPRAFAARTSEQYVMRIYGFKVSERSRAGPRMSWLRQRPVTQQEQEELERCSYLPLPDDPELADPAPSPKPASVMSISEA